MDDRNINKELRQKLSFSCCEEETPNEGQKKAQGSREAQSQTPEKSEVQDSETMLTLPRAPLSNMHELSTPRGKRQRKFRSDFEDSRVTPSQMSWDPRPTRQQEQAATWCQSLYSQKPAETEVIFPMAKFPSRGSKHLTLISTPPKDEITSLALVNTNPFTPKSYRKLFLQSSVKRKIRDDLEEVGPEEGKEEQGLPAETCVLWEINMASCYKKECSEVEKIGVGEFGMVYKCIKSLERSVYAVKHSMKTSAGFHLRSWLWGKFMLMQCFDITPPGTILLLTGRRWPYDHSEWVLQWQELAGCYIWKH